MKTEVGITGLWTRKIGKQIQVLIEIENEWRLVSEINYEHMREMEHGHIMEGSFLLKAPKDDL